MIGSPQNNFNTMQSQQPKSQALGKALSNSPDTQDRQSWGDRSVQGYTQPSQTWQPSMMASAQYGSPTPQMANWQMPESNAGYNLQPIVPNNQSIPQGPIGMNQTGQNRFGVGLARPMPQQTQVS